MSWAASPILAGVNVLGSRSVPVGPPTAGTRAPVASRNGVPAARLAAGVPAPAPGAPGAEGGPGRPAPSLPLVSTVGPSFARPPLFRWMFGMSPSANGPRVMPSSSMGDVSQRLTGGVPWSGSTPGPIQGAVAGYVLASLLPGALHTVVSLSARARVWEVEGITPAALSAASLGSVTVIGP